MRLAIRVQTEQVGLFPSVVRTIELVNGVIRKNQIAAFPQVSSAIDQFKERLQLSKRASPACNEKRRNPRKIPAVL